MDNRNPRSLIVIPVLAALLIMLSPFWLNAQNKIIDSLVKKLPATKADTDRVNLLNKIALALYSTDYQKSLVYCKQAEALAQKIHYLKGLAVNSHAQGVVYTFEDDYATALIKEQQAASFAAKANDFVLLAKAYNAVGLIYSRMNDSVRSFAAFNSAIEALNRSSDKSYNAAILHNMAVLYIEKKDFERGLNDLFTAAKQNQQTKNTQWLVQNYYWIGRVYFMKKQYPLAVQYELMAISLCNQYKYYQPLVKSLGILGVTYIAQQKYRQAEATLLQGEQIADEKRIASERLTILESLANFYEQQHDLKTALIYQKKYRDAYKASYNSEKSKLTAEYQARFEDRQKYIENELLKKDSAIKETNIRQRNQLLGLATVAVVVLLILTLLIYNAYYKIKQKNLLAEYQHRQITAQNQQLEHLNQLKDKLFSVLAHDLRGPLFNLKSMMDLYDQGIIDKAEEEMIRKNVLRELNQNSDLINNLLLWGRSQLNGFTITPTAFSVVELTSQIIEQVKAESDHKEIVIAHNQTDIRAFADREMVDTVIRNLLSNAIKFTPQKGKITITETVHENKVLVSVADTGIGMSPAQTARLFKGDFYTTKTSLNPHGTGLGLQICKEFIERNNGEIWVDGEENKGSTFYFTLPLATA